MSEITARTPDVIAAEINLIRDRAKETLIGAAIEIGGRLREAKELVARGEWGAWLEKNVDYSERTAQNLMRLHEEYGQANPQALADLNVTKALSLLALPPIQREAFTAEQPVAEMSTRQLDAEIEKYKRKAREAEQAARRAATERDGMRRNYDAAQGVIQQAQERERKAADEAAHYRERAENAEKALAMQQVAAAALPPEVEEELEQLRQLARTAPCKEVILLRDAYDRWKGGFDDIRLLLEDADKTCPQEAVSYRTAIKRACAAMGEML